MGPLQGQGFQVDMRLGQELGKGVAYGHLVGGGLGSGNGTITGCKGHCLQDGWQHMVVHAGQVDLRQEWCSSWKARGSRK